MKSVNKGIFPLEKLLDQFMLQGKVESVKPFGGGHINDTYLLSMETEEGKKRYVIQKINKSVFKKPWEVMENIMGVTSFLRRKIAETGGDPERETLHFLLNKDGKAYMIDDEGEYWRGYRFVENTFTYNQMDSPQAFRTSAQAFGHFQNMLQDYPSDTLFETIPNFHNTISRFADFEKAVADNLSGRRIKAEKEVQFLLNRKEHAARLLILLEKGELPLRVTHNDTKINNVLFDGSTGKSICVIDLDTVMPGLSAYDFGDSIRTGASTAAEDEPDLTKVHFDMGMFQAYVEGFLAGCNGSLTSKEQEMLPYGAIVITYEQALRFLGDYLNGDTYYKVSRPEQNLERARTQIRLVEEMEQQLEKMLEVVRNGI